MNKEEKNMERYTLREGGRVLCPTERLEAALERLAAFEDLACGPVSYTHLTLPTRTVV